MKSLTVATAVAALLLALVLPEKAWGQVAICGERQAVLDRMAQGYGETVVARGVTLNGSVVERLESRDGWTWTLIVTTPDGISCFMASGEGWQAVVPVKGTDS